MTEVLRRPRPAARILLTNAAGEVLLFRFAPPDRPPFWCTPGGAADPGESFSDCARRELREETGLDTDVGPEVARRLVEFTTLEGVPVTGDERYFRVRVGSMDVSTGGHTELEQQCISSWRWFDREALAQLDEEVFPDDLFDLLEMTGD